MDLHIIIPKGKLEVVERDLMILAAVISHFGLGKDAGGGMHEYGAQYNCEVFMMNPFCWCERQDCPWCCSCTCSNTLEPTCDFCTTSLFPEYGTEPGRPAPNFWYKPTNLKIWWYKYIGRDMEYNRKFRMSEWQNIFRHCLEAVIEAADRKAFGKV